MAQDRVGKKGMNQRPDQHSGVQQKPDQKFDQKQAQKSEAPKNR